MPYHPDQIGVIARRLVRRYGPHARGEAAAWSSAMLDRDDLTSAVVWAQVTAAVSRLLEIRIQAQRPRFRIKAGRLITVPG